MKWHRENTEKGGKIPHCASNLAMNVWHRLKNTVERTAENRKKVIGNYHVMPNMVSDSVCCAETLNVSGPCL